MPELAVIIVVALVVLGPKRLPEVARSLGKGLAEFRRLTGDVNKELEAARHMIESEARDHENERRRQDRETRHPAEKSVAAQTAPASRVSPEADSAATGTSAVSSADANVAKESTAGTTDKEGEG